MPAPKRANTAAATVAAAAAARRRKLAAAAELLRDAGVDQWVAELLAGLTEAELLQVKAKLDEISGNRT